MDCCCCSGMGMPQPPGMPGMLPASACKAVYCRVCGARVSMHSYFALFFGRLRFTSLLQLLHSIAKTRPVDTAKSTAILLLLGHRAEPLQLFHWGCATAHDRYQAVAFIKRSTHSRNHPRPSGTVTYNPRHAP